MIKLPKEMVLDTNIIKSYEEIAPNTNKSELFEEPNTNIIKLHEEAILDTNTANH